jgi:aminoglycoside phosphotransferase (APT) family kinase protein
VGKFVQSVEPNDNSLLEIAQSVLPGSGWPIVECTADGVSTPVFRIYRGGVTRYLRLAESPEANLAPEVLVHGLLRDRGVRVPEVVYFESFNSALGRSVMVTTEIAGDPIGSKYRDVDVGGVLREAGRDLALMHTIPVEGFGWIRRNQPDGARLWGRLPTLRSFALEDLTAHLADLHNVLAASEIRTIDRAITDGASLLTTRNAVLVHGDLDASHVFHHQGKYSGIIDFGEIRGADPFYDLGHFALHDGEQIPYQVLPSLLTGYGEVTPLPPDAEQRIRLWSLLIGVRALARSVTRPQSTYQSHLITAIWRTLSELSP